MPLVPAHGGSIPCQVADDQVGKLVEAIELGPKWLEEVLAIISLKDEVDRVKKARQAAQEKLRRMAKAYIDGVFPDEEYHRQKRLLEMELESLVVPSGQCRRRSRKADPESQGIVGRGEYRRNEEAALVHAGCRLLRRARRPSQSSP